MPPRLPFHARLSELVFEHWPTAISCVYDRCASQKPSHRGKPDAGIGHPVLPRFRRFCRNSWQWCWMSVFSHACHGVSNGIKPLPLQERRLLCGHST